MTVKSDCVSVWMDEVKQFDYKDEDVLSCGRAGIKMQRNADGECNTVVVTFALYQLGVADDLPGDNPFVSAPDPVLMNEVTEAAVIYVAVNGKDSWSGCLDRPNAEETDGPVASLAVAVEKASQLGKKCMIVLRGGTYYLDDTVRLDAEANGITFTAYKDETPIISGGKRITSAWSSYKDGIWKTALGEEFEGIDIRQLFVNSDRATRSREPDDGVFQIEKVDVNKRYITAKGAWIPTAWENIDGIEINSRGAWHYNRQKVASISALTQTVYTQQEIGSQASGQKVTTADWFYMENALAFVDEAGEWYYDSERNLLYYKAEEGQDPNDLEFVIPGLATLLEINGGKDAPVYDVVIDGLTFAHTTWEMPDTERNGIQAGFWGNKSDEPVYAPLGAVMMTYVEESVFQNCTFTNMGDGAITFGAGTNSNLIYGCKFQDIGANVIQIGYRHTYKGTDHVLQRDWDDLTDTPAGNEIINNLITDCCWVDQGSCAIWVGYAHHTLLEGNTISNLPYTGISTGWRWSTGVTSSHHTLIQHNYLQNVMQTMDDGAAIYQVGERYGDRTIDNYINGSGGDLSGHWANALYSDNCSNYSEVGDNFCLNFKGLLHAQNGNGADNNYYNNIEAAPADTTLYGCKMLEQRTEKLAVNFTVVPENATITVYDGDTPVAKNDRSIDAWQLENGIYRAVVSADGYKSYEGDLVVHGQPLDVKINLEQITYEVNLTITPQDATVVIYKNNEPVSASGHTYQLTDGEYTYTVARNGYKTQKGSFTVKGAPLALTIHLKRENEPGDDAEINAPSTGEEAAGLIALTIIMLTSLGLLPLLRRKIKR